MTYGEVWIAHSNSVRFNEVPIYVPKRMKKHEAIKYYKQKLQDVWDILYPISPRDFLCLDDYFDYFEAKRTLKGIYNVSNN